MFYHNCYKHVPYVVNGVVLIVLSRDITSTHTLTYFNNSVTASKP